MQVPAVADIVAGSGLSTEADPVAAGKAAAGQASKALGGKPAKLVLVFGNYPQAAQAKVLDGVTSVFAKEVVHGCSAASPITAQGNPKGRSVGVYALAGDIEVAAAVSPKIGGKHLEAGQALAKALPKMAKAKVMLLFGNCHVPRNKPLTKGVQSVLGTELPIVGGSSGGPSTDSYFKGEVRGDVVVGILLGGDFKVGVCALPGRGNDEVIRTAVAAACSAAGKLPGKPSTGFLFECAGRRGTVKRLGDELAAIQGVLGKEFPVIGFYGTGEIGPIKGVSTGVGYHVVCCLIGQ